MAVTKEGVALQTVEDAMRFCTWCVESGMLPPEISNPKRAFAIMARGAELGLKPFSSWRYIYMTKAGRLAIEAKGALAVCRASPAFEDYDEGTEGEGEETVAWAIAKRKGQTAKRKEFSYAQAERAGLVDQNERRSREGKVYKTPWQAYLEDMLLAKAKSRVLELVFPDVLGGMPIQGEAEDIDKAIADREGRKPAPEGPPVRDPLLDDLGPASPENQEVIDAQVNEIFPPTEEALEEYQGEVMPEEEPEPPREEAQQVHAAECEGCGTMYHPDRAGCPACGLAKGALPGPPSQPKVEEDANKPALKKEKKARKKGSQKDQPSLLDD